PNRAALWWDRARPCHLAQARAHDGRRRDRDERAGQRLGVHGAAAGRRDTLAKATDGAIRKVSARAGGARVGALINAGLSRMAALGAKRARRNGGNDAIDPIRTLGGCAYTRF